MENESCEEVPHDHQRVYLVPYRWWKEAHHPESSTHNPGLLYSASLTSSAGPIKIIRDIFNSDLAFNLRRQDDASLHNSKDEPPPPAYALVPADSWLQALKWHSDSKSVVKDGKKFLAAEDDMSDVYPLQLRLNVSRENSSLGVKISKKR